MRLITASAGRYPRKAGIWGNWESAAADAFRFDSGFPQNSFVRARSCPKRKAGVNPRLLDCSAIFVRDKHGRAMRFYSDSLCFSVRAYKAGSFALF